MAVYASPWAWRGAFGRVQLLYARHPAGPSIVVASTCLFALSLVLRPLLQKS